MSRLSRLAMAVVGILVIGPPADGQVLDLGDGGVFANLVAPANAGRNVGAFWDNRSNDQSATVEHCNVGFFAAGTFEAGCRFQTLGTFANQGGYLTYFGNGAGNRGAPAFMFQGADYSYELTLIGAVSSELSEIGIFTRSALTGGGYSYSFVPIPAFSSKVVNASFSIGGGGPDWGFYIRNTFNPLTGGCESPDTDCSDATGGFAAAPFQQFALFAGSGGQYLVGAEDGRDFDYQDYLISVVTTSLQSAVVVTPTPEPLSMMLLATGLVLLAGAGMVQGRRGRKSVSGEERA